MRKFIYTSYMSLLALAIALPLAGFSPSTEAAAFPSKYHPGHYMKVYPTSGPRTFETIKNNRHIKGAYKRYYWDELEPSQGRYDFSEIESDLRYLKSINKQLFIQFADSSHGSPAVPRYVRTSFYGGGSYRASNGIYHAKLWNSNVVDREIRIINALGARFNRDPNFEGLHFSESSVAIRKSQWRSASYTPDRLREGIMRLMTAAKRAFPNSVVFQGLNYFAGDGSSNLAEIARHAHRVGVGLGGPNTKVDGRITAYRHWEQYSGTVPLSIGVEYGDYDQWDPASRRTVTVERLRNFDRNDLQVNYIFWVIRKGVWQNEVIPMINRDPQLRFK